MKKTPSTSLSSLFHRARRDLGKKLIPDVIAETVEEYQRQMDDCHKECSRKNEEYKKKIDEYVEHFMRCKIERDFDYPTRLRFTIEYDARAFYCMNDLFSPQETQARRFMAREIAYRVEKEVSSARLVAPAEPRRGYVARYASEGDEAPSLNR